jgi:hypothetical protein
MHSASTMASAWLCLVKNYKYRFLGSLTVFGEVVWTPNLRLLVAKLIVYEENEDVYLLSQPLPF